MAKEIINENLTDTYMPISRRDAYAMGFESTDICIRRIGIKNETCITTECTPEFKKWWETTLDTEARTALRNKRCMVPDCKGGFIRCPEGNSCEKCKEINNPKFTTNRPLSLDQLQDPEGDDASPFDVAGNYLTENDLIALATLEDLIKYLGTFEGKHYDTIFQMLYDEYSVKEIADELGMPWSTTKDAVKRVQSIAQEYTGYTRD